MPIDLTQLKSEVVHKFDELYKSRYVSITKILTDKALVAKLRDTSFSCTLGELKSNKGKLSINVELNISSADIDVLNSPAREIKKFKEEAINLIKDQTASFFKRFKIEHTVKLIATHSVNSDVDTKAHIIGRYITKLKQETDAELLKVSDDIDARKKYLCSCLKLQEDIDLVDLLNEIRISTLPPEEKLAHFNFLSEKYRNWSNLMAEEMKRLTKKLQELDALSKAVSTFDRTETVTLLNGDIINFKKWLLDHMELLKYSHEDADHKLELFEIQNHTPLKKQVITRKLQDERESYEKVMKTQLNKTLLAYFNIKQYIFHQELHSKKLSISQDQIAEAELKALQESAAAHLLREEDLERRRQAPIASDSEDVSTSDIEQLEEAEISLVLRKNHSGAAAAAAGSFAESHMLSTTYNSNLYKIGKTNSYLTCVTVIDDVTPDYLEKSASFASRKKTINASSTGSAGLKFYGKAHELLVLKPGGDRNRLIFVMLEDELHNKIYVATELLNHTNYETIIRSDSKIADYHKRFARLYSLHQQSPAGSVESDDQQDARRRRFA